MRRVAQCNITRPRTIYRVYPSSKSTPSSEEKSMKTAFSFVSLYFPCFSQNAHSTTVSKLLDSKENEAFTRKSDQKYTKLGDRPQRILKPFPHSLLFLLLCLSLLRRFTVSYSKYYV